MDVVLENLPTTGYPLVDAVLQIVGAVYVICSALLLFLPKHWAFTQRLAKFFADLKGVLGRVEDAADKATEARAKVVRKKAKPEVLEAGYLGETSKTYDEVAGEDDDEGDGPVSIRHPPKKDDS